MRKVAIAVAMMLAAVGLVVVSAAAPAQALTYTGVQCFNPFNPPTFLPTLPGGSGYYVTGVGAAAQCSYLGTDQFGNNAVFYYRGELEGFYDDRGQFTPVEVCYDLTRAVTGDGAPRAGWEYASPRLNTDCALNHAPVASSSRLICTNCPRFGRVANSAGFGASAVASQNGTDPTSRNGASGLAPEVSATIYGTRMATTTATASGSGCQTTLADRRLKVTAHNDIEVFACLTFVSAGQINFYLPSTTPILGYDTSLTGYVQLYDGNGNELNANGSHGIAVPLRKFAPGLYSQSQDGLGLPAAYILRVGPDGSQVTEGISASSPVVLGDDRVFLILYGTGVRFADPSRLTLRMGGTCDQSRCGGPGPFVGIQWFGPAPGYGATGVDQINVELPHSADAVGHDVLIWLSADESAQSPEIGRYSNVLHLWIQL